MQKRLLILLTGDPVPTAHGRRGDFGRLIRESTENSWPHAWSVLDLRDALYLPPPEQLAGVIVSGSPARLAERADWMLRGLDYLRDLVAQATPTLGICFGHQMLGEALGGAVGENPQGREIGTVEVTPLENNPLLDERHDDVGPPPLMANSTHVDSVVELPAGAQVVAHTELEPHAVVRFGERAWGVQFHPEIDREVMRCYLDERRAAIESEGLDVDLIRHRATDALHGKAVLRRFIENVVGESRAGSRV